jgi:hypothetical protein
MDLHSFTDIQNFINFYIIQGMIQTFVDGNPHLMCGTKTKYAMAISQGASKLCKCRVRLRHIRVYSEARGGVG